MKKIAILLLTVAALLSFACCAGKRLEEQALAAPVITLNGDNSISWTEVSGANEYVVLLNGEELPAVTNTFFAAETAAGSYTVRVKAVSGEHVSAWSNEVSYTVGASLLAAPVITLNGDNSISWAAVSGATGYVAEVNGVLTEAFTQTELAAYTEEGDYSIRVKAVGDSEGQWSNTVVYTVTDVTKLLSLVEFAEPVTMLRAQHLNYLNAETGSEEADITRYANGATDVGAYLRLEWECSMTGNVTYTVEVSTDENFQSASAYQTSKLYVKIYNLYNATTYYWRVTAIPEAGEEVVKTSVFTTVSGGPRVITVDGIYNVRDLGGYLTELGKVTKQGLLYRGSEMNGTHNIDITQAGIETMTQELGIVSDIDLRASSEANGATQSPLGADIKFDYFTIGNYLAAFSQTEQYRRIFSYLADETNYPAYFHCWGGADRTGTVAFLINGLLGVSYEDLVKDFEFTSFSIFGIRAFNGTDGLALKPVYDKIMSDYEGDTLSEKIENYMLSIGVTETEIYNIRAIMFGEPTRAALSAPSKVNTASSSELTLTLTALGSRTVSKVVIGGVDCLYTFADNVITVQTEQLSQCADGTLNGTVYLSDDQTLSFSFLKESYATVALTDYIAAETTLNASLSAVTSQTAVGYDVNVRGVLLSSGVNTSGGIGISIGSYGVYLRGGEFRIYRNGVEVGRYLNYNCRVDVFRNGNMAFEIRIETVDENTVRLHISTDMVSGGTSEEEVSYTHEFTSRDSEIASSEATLKLWISTADVDSLIVKS